MELTKFLSLCGMMLGFIATVFLSKVLFAGADDFLNSTVHYSPTGWPSSAMISGMASQKADTWASVILIFLALILQVISLFVKGETQVGNNTKDGVINVFYLLVAVAIITGSINIVYKNYVDRNIKKKAAYDRISTSIEKSSVPLYSDVEEIADQYFRFKKNSEETNIGFVKRFAKYVGYDVPEDADFSKFR